ncbi:hypothetical protein GLAREA_10061 [Glarea lozoyensis ATCC 20868]|uniref:Uncharacterized protein n=1 Tax=Glarea lozoyensis (strain ATCC 20868 / MF5171) TaxID=1116229 RepID=S3D7A2_GLAL2|nr:uncharacterized protein GLAREA_10061 [Glarea lozoyensis ATCC 20868]EPE34367.1 hypothetical protein GLAREA_10061 [Glarea lozoyensis ATCC 20868]
MPLHLTSFLFVEIVILTTLATLILAFPTNPVVPITTLTYLHVRDENKRETTILIAAILGIAGSVILIVCVKWYLWKEKKSETERASRGAREIE